MSAQVETASSEAQALGHESRATAIVGTPSQSTAASLKHPKPVATDESRNASLIEAGEPPRTKDRAPAFVVCLCLFQSLAGLLFGKHEFLEQASVA